MYGEIDNLYKSLRLATKMSLQILALILITGIISAKDTD